MTVWSNKIFFYLTFPVFKQYTSTFTRMTCSRILVSEIFSQSLIKSRLIRACSAVVGSQLCGLFSICCRKRRKLGANTNNQFPLVRKKFHSNSAFIFRHNFKETRGICIALEILKFTQKQWRQHECFWSKRSCWQLQIPIWQLLPEHDVIHFAVNRNRHRFVSFRVFAPIS